MKDNEYITALKAAMNEVAHEAIKVGNPDLFDYGRYVGIYEGLERAESMLSELYEERDGKERDL